MNASTRVFFMVVWLGALALAGSIVLSLTASRVGEHKSSTYGNAYMQFQESWGGEIGIVPPTFSLVRTYTESEYNSNSKQYEDVEKTATYALVPRSIHIESDLNYGEQERDLLVFNAFEAKNQETYVLVNKSGYAGNLVVKLSKPQNANLLHNYTIMIPSRNNLVIRPEMEKTVPLIPDVSAGEQLDVIITYSTKGMDIFKYNLSAYQNNVIEGITSTIKLNTSEFEIYRFGLPHEVTATSNGSQIKFDVDDFSTTQDLGITFLSKQRYLDQIQSLMNYSPMALILFLVVIFFFSQIYSVRFNAFHYLFLAMIVVFYYLFVAYLIRFFGVIPTFGISILLTTVMFLLYGPNVFGWWFASRIAGTYLFLLTVVFSLIFLLPIFRGLMFVILIFLIFMSIMIFVSRSDISKWSIVSESLPAPAAKAGD